MESKVGSIVEFQSTPPARGATSGWYYVSSWVSFQSTPPARGATPVLLRSRASSVYFNPRPPRGGRLVDFRDTDNLMGFQSTPPARGATFSAQIRLIFSAFQSTPPARGATPTTQCGVIRSMISIHAPREGGDSKDVQFYLRIFDKQVELLRFLGIIRGGCLRNPEKDRRFLGKSLANLPEISGHLDFAGGGKARPGYPCAVPLPRRAACVRGSGDPPADRCSSYRNAPLFSHIASPGSKSADCLSQNP